MEYENWNKIEKRNKVKNKEGGTSQRNIIINGNNKARREEQQKAGRGSGVVQRKQRFIVQAAERK